jgi:hypothetical protein
LTAAGARTSLALRGFPADPSIAPSGSAQVWFFDNTAAQQDATRLQAEAAQARAISPRSRA